MSKVLRTSNVPKVVIANKII